MKNIFLLLIVLYTHSISYAQVTIQLNNSQDYITEAINLFKNNNWEAGKNIVDKGLLEFPIDSDLKMLSGKYYHHFKQYDRARYDLNKALELNPNNVDAKQILVNVEMESERYSSAICYVNELLEVNPYWKGLWRKKIELYELQNNHIEANRLRKRIRHIYPKDSTLKKDYLYSIEVAANAQREEGKIDNALELSKKLVKENPQREDYYLNVVNDNLKAGDNYAALAFVERGLNQFPQNDALINKKAGILAEQNRYDELLEFLQKKKRRKQYNYYLKEAARNAKDKDPVTLYGKVFYANPSNTEAFTYVFNDAMAKHQYEEALFLLNKHRQAAGGSKKLSVKELSIYKSMGNDAKAASFTKELFYIYPNDSDIKDDYVKIMLISAKNKMESAQYYEAIADWQQVGLYGDNELNQIAQNAIYNAYLAQGDYNNALNALNELIFLDANNKDLFLKRAEIYYLQKNYHKALNSYEQALNLTDGEQKLKYKNGYADMATKIISELNKNFRHTEALKFTKHWLTIDPKNQNALRYAVNLSHQTGNTKEMFNYAQEGSNYYPDDVFFKIKLAEIKGQKANLEEYAQIYHSLHKELKINPYHKLLLNTFSQITEDYSYSLLREKLNNVAITKIDTALNYIPNNNNLKYIKGLAFEKLKQYDSAYYYQSFYEPSNMEASEFKEKLNYLKSRGYKNSIGISHIRSRHGDHYAINTISTIEYARFEEKNTYIGRINYAGRPSGKGIQIQGEWLQDWNERTSTMINAAWANQFFPEITLNASVYRYFNILNGMQFELGVGYRKLSEPQITNTNNNMFNVVAGVTKELDQFRLNTRINAFLLDKKLLYNLSLNTRYYFSSPKNYITAVGSIGSSPDVELVNYQLYDGFSVLNTMVGAGFGWNIYKNVYGNFLGTWYNYKVNGIEEVQYKNLYNLYFGINVAF